MQDEATLQTAWDAARRAWLADKRRNTARAYAAAWRDFFAWAEVPPWEVTAELARAWASHLRDSVLAPSTVNLRLSALSSFYDVVCLRATGSAAAAAGLPLPGWEVGRPNPFQGTRRATPSSRGRARSLSAEGVRAILAAINTRRITGARDFALLLTLLATGRHVSNVLGMRWGDLEPLGNSGFLLTYPGPDGAPRATALPNRCYQAIRAYLDMDGRPPGRMSPDDLIFLPISPQRVRRLPGHAGSPPTPNRPLSTSYANRILKKYARRAGIEPSRATLHALRKAGRLVAW
jgi:integrase